MRQLYYIDYINSDLFLCFNQSLLQIPVFKCMFPKSLNWKHEALSIFHRNKLKVKERRRTKKTEFQVEFLLFPSLALLRNSLWEVSEVRQGLLISQEWSCDVFVKILWLQVTECIKLTIPKN